MKTGCAGCWEEQIQVASVPPVNSAIVETLKVNYTINDSALQAVGPYYASIIPRMGTQRRREGKRRPPLG